MSRDLGFLFVFLGSDIRFIVFFVGRIRNILEIDEFLIDFNILFLNIFSFGYIYLV